MCVYLLAVDTRGFCVIQLGWLYNIILSIYWLHIGKIDETFVIHIIFSPNLQLNGVNQTTNIRDWYCSS
jgi:hypothetical protein